MLDVGFRDEKRREHLPEGGVISAPSSPQSAQQGEPDILLLYNTSERGVKDQVGDALRVANGILDSRRPALRNPEQSEFVEAYGIHNGFQVLHPPL